METIKKCRRCGAEHDPFNRDRIDYAAFSTMFYAVGRYVPVAWFYRDCVEQIDDLLRDYANKLIDNWAE